MIMRIRLFPILVIFWLVNISSMPRELYDVNNSSTTITSTSYSETLKKYLHNYIWPTDASEKVTSSFGEYRTAHFHAGIDISTNGTTGYKVFAVADGYVYRIRIQANGYGKMLFVRHHDGLYSTYAHLSKFSQPIEEIAHKEQMRSGTYQIDMLLAPQLLPVKQGDIVAYTGDTGFGPPHLHFELRDSSFNPINPLLGSPFAVDDKIRPTIRRLMIQPLSYFSTVDGRNETRFFSRFPRYNRNAKIPQQIRIHGQIGIGIDASDRSDGSWSKNGIHRIELYLDDSLCHSMELNTIPNNETNQIDIHYDLASIIDGYGRYQKLYIDKGNALPFYYPKQIGSGIINTDEISEGLHNYRIVCYDIADNMAELTGTFFANHRPELHFNSFDATTLRISTIRATPFVKFLLYGKRTYQPSWELHTLTKERFDIEGKTVVLPVNTKPYDVIKIIGITASGSESEPLYHFIKKPNGPERTVHTDVRFLDGEIELILTTPGIFTESPDVILHEGQTSHNILVKPVDLSKYTGAFSPADNQQGKHSITIHAEINGRPVDIDREITFYSIPSDRNGSLNIPDEDIIIYYDSAAAYKPSYFFLKKETDGRIITYTPEPKDILLNNGITVSLPTGNFKDDDHIGLYHRSSGGWIFLTADRTRGGKYMSAKINRMLGEFAIMPDETPPSIGRLRVHAAGGKLSASFRYHDNLSGVDPDEIKMFIDDGIIIPEIDGEHRKVTYLSTERLPAGAHYLKITVADRMKNKYEISRRFVAR
jgi:Peptidase family M23